MKLTTVIFITAFLLIQSTNGIYFHIREGSVKCFIEEVPEDTLISGSYAISVLDNDKFVRNPDYGVHVEVKDPEGNPVLSRVYSSEGKFVVTSLAAGEHSICLSTRGSSWSKALLRVSLDIAVGDHATDYKEVASREKLNDIQLRIRQLLDQVAMLAKDQDFQRAREEYFRRLSESINSRVTLWSIVQVVLLVLTGVFQMRNLRSFFLAKKLV
ncbi:unnamed protein product [Hymenolepis diminuta]|uniref:GOLD domain-containing protein n=1 Tax=Hymenolepis diminuta TaxID=6216 RepID=A0A0R3ST00_HYMDI|nr:unnamed protein product [Hymenolepis diminuta]VUZ49981.1 unnamed protein product [Hymenolepis diminuta]